MAVNREALTLAFETEGLTLLGIVSPTIGEDGDRFQYWLDGKEPWLLNYMEKYTEIRKEPVQIFPGTKSVMVFGLHYQQQDTLKSHGSVAQYARFSDYHKLLKIKAERAMKTVGLFEESRVFVDSAPVLERALAKKIPKGFIGKNTCFIHEEEGSFFLLGEGFCRAAFPIEEKEGEKDLWGECTACQTVCPTGALSKGYVLDSKLCLAYWTIEHRGAIPKEFWPYLEKYYFGCDLCQLACPFNSRKAPARNLPLREFPDLFTVATMREKEYSSYFGGTPMTRAKRGGLQRNALIAMYVSGHPRLSEAMALCGNEPSPVAETLLQITEDQNSKIDCSYLPIELSNSDESVVQPARCLF